MDAKKFQILLCVVRAQSINAAAEKLGYTQSGLTYLLNTLEDELGVQLLNRTRSGVTLSEDGNKLLPYIRGFLDAEAVLHEQLNRITARNSGEIRIGAYVSIASYWLPNILADFHSIYPNVKIDVRVGSLDIPKWLENDEIDIAVAEQALSDGFDWHFIYDDPMCAAIPTSNHLSQQPEVELAEISKYPLVFPSNNTKNTVAMGMQKLGLTFQNNVNISTSEGISLLRLVGSGLGITFISKLYTAGCPDTVKLLPLSPPITRPLGVISRGRRPLSPQIQDLIRLLKENVPS